MKILTKIKNKLCGRITGYERQIIINIGLNARYKKETDNEIKEIVEIIKIKLKDYLEQYPHYIKFK